ncbi:MAG: thioesterase family protein [Acidimicrobiia bacterium]|nr:thioesterase family protein [Acidimicrobiia bacterium]
MATIERLTDLLSLEPHGSDVYVGESPEYPWGPRVYGGQVIAQALWAAADTVDPRYAVHSLHSYFIRGGQFDEPIRYEVDRIRNGRSFLTRRVVARQSSGAILNLSASFQVAEDAVDVQPLTPPAVPEPDVVDADGWTPVFERRAVATEGARSLAWLRLNGPLPDNPVVHACAIAYASDDVPMEAITATHPATTADDERRERFMGASLDHSVWFHRPAPADDWLLYDMRSQGLHGSRGLTFGEIFTAAGLHVASIAQEGLLRELR